jgi:hypothetical protein
MRCWKVRFGWKTKLFRRDGMTLGSRPGWIATGGPAQRLKSNWKRRRRRQLAKHLIPKHELDQHQKADYCACGPIPQIDPYGNIVWIHRPLVSNEADILHEAQAILEATSVRLWEAAEMKGGKLHVIPFTSKKPIQLPKSAWRQQPPKQ